MRYTDTFAKKLVDQMTLDQKVGAVLTLGFAGVVPKPYICLLYTSDAADE